MFQKFFTDTIMSKFIKGLLSNTNIPLFNFVKDNDYIIKDAIYIYNHWIIKCLESGNLKIEDNEILYPSYRSIPDTTSETDSTTAAFTVLGHFNNEDNSKYNYKYKSSIQYYDSETHKHLGNYLRYLRDKEHLNLMMYYNCYNYYMIDDLSLVKDSTQSLVGWELNTLPGYKLAAVPIKFNKEYTIAIDCPTEVLLRGVIYGPCGMIKESFASNLYYSDKLNNSGKIYPQMQYKNPILYSIKTDDISVYEREKYLYLVIQLPESCNSAITVLEGTYNYNSSTIRHQVAANSRAIWNAATEPNIPGTPGCKPILNVPIMVGEYSLLSINPQESYAFSDRLIEYLLHNVINHKEELTRNIDKLQKILGKIDSNYRAHLIQNNASYGTWDDEIPKCILNLIQSYNTELINKGNRTVPGVYFRDMDGYVNKDVEEFFLRLGGYKLDGTDI